MNENNWSKKKIVGERNIFFFGLKTKLEAELVETLRKIQRFVLGGRNIFSFIYDFLYNLD